MLTPPAGPFADHAQSVSAVVTAATFDATVSRAPVVERRGQTLWITWNSVTISSGAPVGYLVTRHAAGSTPEVACSITDPSPVPGSTLECRDFKPGSGVSYTVRVNTFGPDADTTWTLPPSSPVQA
ncbi:MAG: hypothetical protein ACO35E_01900 [Ilumatobacteraceae bacterium]